MVAEQQAARLLTGRPAERAHFCARGPISGAVPGWGMMGARGRSLAQDAGVFMRRSGHVKMIGQGQIGHHVRRGFSIGSSPRTQSRELDFRVIKLFLPVILIGISAKMLFPDMILDCPDRLHRCDLASWISALVDDLLQLEIKTSQKPSLFHKQGLVNDFLENTSIYRLELCSPSMNIFFP